MSLLPIRFFPENPLESASSEIMGAELQMFRAGINGNQIFISTSFDLGVSWGPAINVPNATSPKAPAIAFIGPQLYVVWLANDTSNTLYFTYSVDYGQTFEPVVQIPEAVTEEAPGIIGGIQCGAIYFKVGNGETGVIPIEH